MDTHYHLLLYYTISQLLDSSHLQTNRESGSLSSDYKAYIDEKTEDELKEQSQQKWHEAAYSSSAISLLEVSSQTSRLHSPMGQYMLFKQSSQNLFCSLWTKRKRLNLPIGGWLSVIGWAFPLRVWQTGFWIISGICETCGCKLS
jgi:hypothetical protein